MGGPAAWILCLSLPCPCGEPVYVAAPGSWCQRQNCGLVFFKNGLQTRLKIVPWFLIPDPLHEPDDGSLDDRSGLSLAPVVSPVALATHQTQDFTSSPLLGVLWAFLWLGPGLSHQKSKRLSPALENLETSLGKRA